MIEIALPNMVNIQTEDKKLIKQIAKGNEQAFEMLYQRHSKKLFGYAYHILKNKQTAEDVLQETFLTIWQKSNRYRGEGRVVAWLFGITHNLALKAYNQKSTESIPETYPTTQNIENQITTQLLAEHNKQLLNQAMQQLTVEHRTILQLVFYEKMSMNEVSQICQIPVGTVKSRLNYAKQVLKGVITREGITMEEIHE